MLAALAWLRDRRGERSEHIQRGSRKGRLQIILFEVIIIMFENDNLESTSKINNKKM